MRKQFINFVAVIAALVLITSIPFATAQGQGMMNYQYSAGMATVTTEDIGVKVTAQNQVPHFMWWNATSPDEDYHVMFLKLFEAEDTNADGAYDPEVDRIIGAPYLLPSSNWNFSGFNVIETEFNTTEIHFNFTKTETFTPPTPVTTTVTTPSQMSEFNVTIQLRVHISSANPDEMKFDIIISGWEWTSQDSLLVFQFTITMSDHGAEQGDREPPVFAQEGNKFKFGEGYFEFANQAKAGETNIQVQGIQGSPTGEEMGKSVYLAFEYFGNETLEYDPVLGISSSGATDGTDTGDGGVIIDYNQLMLVAGGLSVIVLVLVIVKMKR